MTGNNTPTEVEEPPADTLSIGRRIRHFRKQRGLTLNELGEKVGRAASQISTIENGKRETSVTLLTTIAKALKTEVAELIDPTPVDGRQGLELEAERNQASPMYSSLGLPQVRIKSLPHDALEAIVGLQRQLGQVLERRAATPEEARRANRELRERMREKDNYFADLEAQAAELLRLVGYESGTVSQRQTATIAEKLGFSLHYVSDLPSSTRSISDTANNRLYLPNADAAFDPRSHLLMSLAAHVLGHDSPKDFSEFLQQRVEANYLAAAVLLPQSAAVPMLLEAKRKRELSVEHLRDMFGVGYEVAAHRFTNLATEHLGLPVHFMKVHRSGTIHKAYSNDGLPYPTDALGAIEGQFACKRFTSRTVFRVADRFSPYYQYTDTPEGSYWCTARVLPGGDYAISVGVPFAHVKWFEGRESQIRSKSSCPDLACCRQAPEDLAEKWEKQSLPSAQMHASLLAAVPPGAVPGVDDTEVYEFLERHSG